MKPHRPPGLCSWWERTAICLLTGPVVPWPPLLHVSVPQKSPNCRRSGLRDLIAVAERAPGAATEGDDGTIGHHHQRVRPTDAGAHRRSPLLQRVDVLSQPLLLLIAVTELTVVTVPRLWTAPPAVRANEWDPPALTATALSVSATMRFGSD